MLRPWNLEVELMRDSTISIHAQIANKIIEAMLIGVQYFPRLGVETASNSFHLSMSPSSVLTGGIWSVLHGYDL